MATVKGKLAAPLVVLAVIVLTMDARAEQVRDVRREPVGTASLAGTVFSADEPRTPLRRVRIIVTGGALVGPRITVTDDNGRFAMGALAAGQYSIAAEKSGYLKMNYGATRPSRLGTSVVLTDGQNATGLTIALPRGAVIAGTVTNSAGEPEPDMEVTALHWRLANGERTLMPVAFALTDDRGDYRLAGLNRGDYLVSVNSLDSARAPADLVQVAEGAVERALREIQQAAAASRVTSSPVGPRPLGPAPVFYPGTVRAAEASTVTLAGGEERDGIDIRTELVPMARITGTVSADGRPVAGVQVILVTLGPPAPSDAYGIGGRLGPRTTDARGEFTFVGVPPGEYRVQASTRPIGGRSGGPPPDPNPRMAFVPVDINGDDHTIDLALQPGMEMSGRFVFDGAAAPPSLAGAQVVLEGLMVSPSLQVAFHRADAAPDATFRATGLTPGRYLLSATAPASAPASGWAVKSIVANQRDLLDAPFALAPGETLSDLVVTFTNSPSELTGALQNSAGTTTTDYFIVVFSTGSAFWFPNSRRIVAVRPDSTGTYVIRNLPPGDYFLSALTDVETGEWFNPEFLRELAAASPIRIAIGEGEKKRQDLRIGR